MTERTLTDTFGANATQDATKITIFKADLLGLTATENNTAESIIAALTLKLTTALTEEKQISNPDQQVTVVDADINEPISRNNKNYVRKTYYFQFDTEDETNGLNPSSLDPSNY